MCIDHTGRGASCYDMESYCRKVRAFAVHGHGTVLRPGVSGWMFTGRIPAPVCQVPTVTVSLPVIKPSPFLCDITPLLITAFPLWRWIVRSSLLRNKALNLGALCLINLICFHSGLTIIPAAF